MEVRKPLTAWICNHCNTALGMMKDDPKLARKLANYLEKHNGKTNDRSKSSDAADLFCATGSPLSH
jgi:hypothetical protein